MYRDEHVVIGPANHGYAWIAIVKEHRTAMVFAGIHPYAAAVHGMGGLAGRGSRNRLRKSYVGEAARKVNPSLERVQHHK